MIKKKKTRTWCARSMAGMLEITFAEKEEEGGGAGGKMRTFSHTHSPIQSDSHTHQSRATHTLADSERLTHSSIQSRGVLNLVEIDIVA